MKKFWTQFLLRGSLFAWGGPAILCIVWASLKGAGVIEVIEVDTVILGIVSSIIMAFVAAGVSVVHQMEQLPKSMAALIQMSVLYVDYLAVYLINGWLPVSAIGYFTLGFALCFVIVWAIIILANRRTVNKLNAQISK